MSIILDIIVALILVFSFIGGFRSGAVKEFFSLLSLIIALPVSGFFYGWVTSWFAFINDFNWQHLLGFLVTLCIIIIVLQLLFMLIRPLIDKVWSGGFMWNMAGGIFNLINTVIGLIVVVTLLKTYPVWPWLNDLLASSQILYWLTSHLGIVLQLIPQQVRYALNILC